MYKNVEKPKWFATFNDSQRQNNRFDRKKGHETNKTIIYN